MLKFIDKSEYQLPTFKQVSPTEVFWKYKDGETTHSGLFIKGRKSNHLRDEKEFYPFSEVIELGLVPQFDQSAYDAQQAIEQREAKRLQLKAKREANLQLMEHTFADGRVVQVRPQDAAIIQAAIANGVETDWIMKDNTVDRLTVADLQEALASGVAQATAIFDTYMNALKQL